MQDVSVHIVGDGLAGIWLARVLMDRCSELICYGNGKPNTPPVAFVHLFQGRTFRRKQLEVKAFKRAVEFWAECSLAQEWSVERRVDEGGRLHRSAHDSGVPPEYAPKESRPLHFQYGPGFTVAAQRLVETWRGQLGSKFLSGQVDPGELEGARVFANGLEIAKRIPSLSWDTNPGRTVEGFCSEHPDEKPEYLVLAKGFHLGGNPNCPGFTIGGRVNSKGQAKNDEAQLAREYLGKPVSIRSEWWGKRIANAADRWPLIGWLNDTDFVFAGFGGRALFWLPYCAPLAADAVLSGTNTGIPESLSVARFNGHV